MERTSTEWVALRPELEKKLEEGISLTRLAKEYGVERDFMGFILECLQLETKARRMAREIAREMSK